MLRWFQRLMPQVLHNARFSVIEISKKGAGLKAGAELRSCWGRIPRHEIISLKRILL
jgi:hypothetical protein